MTTLISLPFDVQVIIVRYLNLYDCISFAQVSTACHDLVYYVFSHRAELDFSSVLTDDDNLSLSESLFLQVLYAHTRVTSIRNFCILNHLLPSLTFHVIWIFTGVSHLFQVLIQPCPSMILSLVHMLDTHRVNSSRFIFWVILVLQMY